MSNYAFRLFEEKCKKVLAAHGLEIYDSAMAFSNDAIDEANKGNWNPCVKEVTRMIAAILAPHLAPWHTFVAEPYVREVSLPDGTALRLAIVNEQSREWYGSDSFVSTCDFLIEKDRGCFENAFRFADLGGHQMVWATYYALTSRFASVVSYEPSVLNCLIGLFNCLANDVIDRVEVVPFAVAAKSAASNDAEGEKMLVDFMTMPLRTITLAETIGGPKDFVKTDIEGYEYEMLMDPDYVELLKAAPFSHFELHLGHLVRRGITREVCVEALKTAGLNGTELYSGKDMYTFLENCDRESYPAFILKA
jgi:hypothetical protein